MKQVKSVAAGVCALAVCVAGAAVIIPSNNNKNINEEVITKDDYTGNTVLVSAGIASYLDKLGDNQDQLSELTGKVSISEAGIASVFSSYQGSMSEADDDAVSEETQKLDIATDVVPEDSIIAGYNNLGVSNVTDYLNVRQEPSTDAKIIGKMPGNCACEILSEENGWYKIKSGDVEGYVYGEYILTGYDANIKAKESMTTDLVVTATILNVRQEPSTECNVSTSVFEGEKLEILEELDGWYKVDINNLTGYVSADYVKKENSLPTAVEIVEVVANTTYNSTESEKQKQEFVYNNTNANNSSNNNANINTNNNTNSNNGAGNGANIVSTNLDSTVSQTAVDLINYGMQFLGNPYVLGGNSLTAGTDCSGFTMLIYQHFGYSLPRVPSDYLNTGYTLIPVSQAKPGDIFLYNYNGTIGHVGIYVGNGQLLHESTPSQGVKLGSAFYTQPYCALRVIN